MNHLKSQWQGRILTKCVQSVLDFLSLLKRTLHPHHQVFLKKGVEKGGLSKAALTYEEAQKKESCNKMKKE